MSEGSIRDAQLRRELGVPPSFDLVGHLRDLVRVALPAALIAAVCAVIVFVVRDSGPGVYESTVVAEIRSSTPTYGDANLGQLTAPYVALSSDSEVVASIAGAMNNGWDPATVESHITVSPGPSPALLMVKATGGSQAEADKLAGAIVTSLDQAQGARNRAAADASLAELDGIIADLRAELARGSSASSDADEESAPAPDPAVQAELDARLEQQRQLRGSFGGTQLQLLASPNSSGEKVSPKPAAEAMVAFLGVFVIAAEVLVAVGGRRGTTNSPAWVRRLARRYRTGLQIEQTDALTLPLDTVVMLNQRASLGESILILTGAGVQSDPKNFAGAAAERITHAGLTDRWWQSVPTDKLALALVVVTSAESERGAVEDAVRALAEIEVPTRVVLLAFGPSGGLAGLLPVKRSSAEPTPPASAGSPEPAVISGTPGAVVKVRPQRDEFRADGSPATVEQHRQDPAPYGDRTPAPYPPQPNGTPAAYGSGAFRDPWDH